MCLSECPDCENPFLFVLKWLLMHVVEIKRTEPVIAKRTVGVRKRGLLTFAPI